MNNFFQQTTMFKKKYKKKEKKTGKRMGKDKVILSVAEKSYCMFHLSGLRFKIF